MSQPAHATNAASRLDLNLDSSWTFLRNDVAGAASVGFDDSTWTHLDLPHTWNNYDGEKGGAYYRGIGWYRKHLTVDATLTGRSFFIQFDGANIVSDVYVDGAFVGEHKGGYAAFRFDLTPYLHPGNDTVIAVKVNNAYNADIPPLDADYTFFGGLYRHVHLLVTDPIHVDLMDYGSPGVYISQHNVSAASADIQVVARVRNDSPLSQPITVTTRISDSTGTVVQEGVQTADVAAQATQPFNQTLTLTSPHLWDAQTDPYLYQVTVELSTGGTVTDSVNQPLGVRFFSVLSNPGNSPDDNGFFLNGHRLELHGVNRHQDRIDKGWAISDADQDEDFALIREMGATAVRLAHYEHAQRFYDLSDQNGMVLWTELALVDSITNTQAFTDSARQQLIELIRQNENHPSVFFWSISNEVSGAPYYPDPLPLQTQLNALAHSEDPSRPTTLAIFRDGAAPTDLTGFNRYDGWYYGSMADLGPWMDTKHATNPSLKMAISEYGAGASINFHSATPHNHDHSEEYQALFHETYWNTLKTRSYLWATFVWNMFDFASATRNEGDTSGRNDKGLVTYDRKTKKDSFYWYKVNWTSAPLVYITGRRFDPGPSQTDIKIYANTPTVELQINGVSYGTLNNTNNTFVWPSLGLIPGTDTILACAPNCDAPLTSDTVTFHQPPPLSLVVSLYPPFQVKVGVPVSFSVTAHDTSSTVVGGYRGTIHFSSTDPNAILPPDYTFSPADSGTHLFNAVFATLGGQQLTITDVALPSLRAAWGLTTLPGDATTLSLANAPQTTTPGNPFPVLVVAHDAYGNIATGYRGTLHFHSSDIAATLPTDYTFTANDGGQHTFDVALGTFGDESFDAQDVSNAALTATTTIHVRELHFQVRGLSDVYAQTPQTFTVDVFDEDGTTPVLDYTGTLQFTSSDPNATIPDTYTFVTQDAGTHTFPVVFRTPGAQTFTMTNGNRTLTTTPIQVQTPLLRVRNLTTAVAGTSIAFTLDVVGAAGTTALLNYIGTIHISSNDPRATLPTDYTFSNTDAGSHTFTTTFLGAGNQSITVTDTAIAAITTVQSFTVVPNGGHPSFTTQPSSLDAQSVLTTAHTALATVPVITLHDDYGNLATTTNTPLTLGIVTATGCDTGLVEHGTAVPTNGRASFDGLAITAAGFGYRLALCETGQSSITSDSFDIRPPGQYVQMQLRLTPPTNITLGGTFDATLAITNVSGTAIPAGTQFRLQFAGVHFDPKNITITNGQWLKQNSNTVIVALTQILSNNTNRILHIHIATLHNKAQDSGKVWRVKATNLGINGRIYTSNSIAGRIGSDSGTGAVESLTTRVVGRGSAKMRLVLTGTLFAGGEPVTIETQPANSIVRPPLKAQMNGTITLTTISSLPHGTYHIRVTGLWSGAISETTITI